MNVLHPTLLAAGLAAVALPIVIHLLLRRRYRPIAWAAMRFVQTAQRQQRRRRRIEQLLLLIARCLLVALVAIAVAHPYLGASGTRGETTLVLVIDDAIASGAINDGGESEFEAIRAAAIAEVERLSASSGDRVAVVAAGSPPRALIATPSSDLGAARTLVEAMEPIDSAPDFEAALSMSREAVTDIEGGVRIALLSGWRSGSLQRTGERPDAADRPRPGVRSELEITALPPLESERANLRLRSVSVPRGTILLDDTPAARQVVATIDRTGPVDDEAVGRLIPSVGEGAESRGTAVPFRIPPGERETVVSFELPSRPSAAGDAPLVLTATLDAPRGSDAIASDSVRRVALRVSTRVEVGVVRARGVSSDESAIPPAAWIRAALRPDDRAPVRLRELAPGGVDASSLLGLDLVAIARPDLITGPGWESLAAFCRTGGSVILFAPGLAGVNAWSEDAGARIESLRGIASEAVDLGNAEALEGGSGADILPMLAAELGSLGGSVRVNRVLGIDAEASRVVLRTSGGIPVVTMPSEGLWFVGVPASTAWSDLPARPLFVPLMQEIARRSPSRSAVLTATAGRSLGDSVTGGTLRDETTGDQQEIRTLAPPIAGVRTVLDAEGRGIGLAAINADTEGADTVPTDRERVSAALSPLLESSFGETGVRWIGDEAEGRNDAAIASSRLGSLAFAAAAAFALLESLIAAVASRRSAGRVGGAA